MSRETKKGGGQIGPSLFLLLSFSVARSSLGLTESRSDTFSGSFVAGGLEKVRPFESRI